MTTAGGEPNQVVEDYLRLGLCLGRHNPGIVDAYYGPPALAHRSEVETLVPAAELEARATHLLARVDAGEDGISGQRRVWLRAQVRGLEMVARVLSGQAVPYLDEVEGSYGVRPLPVLDDEVMASHEALDRALPGTGDLRERVISARDRHTVPGNRVPEVIEVMSEFLRERTAETFGLPEGEHVEFVLETDKPYSGFNYYDGNLSSRVAINTDLPLPSSSVAHLVAHEAYPGHHTEHCLKEVGLVRRQRNLEESIFLIGTPSCVMAEGLADLALEALLGPLSSRVVEPIFRDLGVHYDVDVVDAMSGFAELATRVRGSLAIDLHDRHQPVEEVERKAERQLLVDSSRARKSVEFLTDPTWRAYVFCYSEGVRLCRDFVGDDPRRFMRLLTEQLTPADLV